MHSLFSKKYPLPRDIQRLEFYVGTDGCLACIGVLTDIKFRERIRGGGYQRKRVAAIELQPLFHSGAEERTRTSTEKPPLDPEPSVSTNSTTSARSGEEAYIWRAGKMASVFLCFFGSFCVEGDRHFLCECVMGIKWSKILPCDV